MVPFSIRSLILAFVSIVVLAPVPSIADETLSIYPREISEDCFGGRAKAYDECGVQMDLLAAAMTEAEQTEKTILIVYGAEWCIWCHVFKSHVKGEYGEFAYSLEGDEPLEMREKVSEETIALAKELADYVKNNFIILNIESQYSDDGYNVLEETGAADAYAFYLPFIYAIDQSGKYTHELPSSDFEISNDFLFFLYRGYDRAIMLEELQFLREASN